MYKYETHSHTFPASICARVSVEDSLAFYKQMGYDGVFITNHFLDGNINADSTLSYEEKLAFFFSDYERGLEVGKELGIKVFCGVELSLEGTDFLVYGLDKQWYYDHPEIMDMKKSDELPYMMEHGALVIQAHPFREAHYIDHIRLFPRHVHGVEVMNACRKPEENKLADIYADHYGLLKFAGSDNHIGPRQKLLAGLSFPEPIISETDFAHKVKAGMGELFTLTAEASPLGE